MPISIVQSPEGFAGCVTGVDCAAPLAPEEVAAIEAGMNKHTVLVFRDQPLTDAQQLAFTLHFGKLEKYATPGDVRKPGDRRLSAGMADLSNLTPDGRIMSAEDRNWLFKLGDRLWHSDSSFRPVTAKYSLLSGRVIPSWGGDTEFADMRAAYEALDDRTKAEIEESRLRALADLFQGFDRLRRNDAGRKREFSPRASQSRAQGPADRPQVAVPVLACRGDRRLDHPGGANAAARPHRACDATPVRPSSSVEAQ